MSEQQNEIEYIEPTQEHVGQMVEVRDFSGSWYYKKLLGIVDANERFVTSDGITIGWKQARIPRPKPQPTEEQPRSEDFAEFEVRETPPPTKPIDWTKPVRTKDKRAVRVLCTDGPGDYPVIGIIDGERRCRTWMINGSELTGTVGPCDLKNAPQRIQREYWVNVYPGNIGEPCMTKQTADSLAKYPRLACVKIAIDCEEGEGL